MKFIIKEQSRKILFAFDLDDTLIRTQSNIVVRNGDKVQKLSPAEYAIYEPKPGDEFDFSEFQGITNPVIIKDTFELFSKALKSTNKLINAETIILTARTPSITSDLQKFLDAQGLKGVELYAVGSSDPGRKAEVIQSFIDQGYNTIRFYDDSPKNVAAVKALKASNPKVDIQAKLIKHELSETIRKVDGKYVVYPEKGGKRLGTHSTKSAAEKQLQAIHIQQHNEIIKPADPSKVNPKELRMGIRVEMEHTNDPKEAAKIALQHLAEDPKYYTKLKSLNLEQVQFTKPNFEFEWEEANRYPEFQELGKEGWIDIAKKGHTIRFSKIKDILGNVDLNFDKLEKAKRGRFNDAFEKGTVEIPIAVKFSDKDYDLVAGNTRLSGLVNKGVDPKIWIVDISSLVEDIHEPMNPGILKKRLGKLSCSKVRAERAKLKDKGTTYAKALQRYLNYHCQ